MTYLAVAGIALLVCVSFWSGMAVALSNLYRDKDIRFIAKRFDRALGLGKDEFLDKAKQMHSMQNELMSKHRSFIWHMITFRDPYRTYSEPLRNELGR